jgi:hypothetical protein
LIAAAVLVAPQFEQPVMALGGVFAAGLSQLLFQLPFIRGLGLLPRPRWGMHDPGVRRILKLMGPALLGSSAAQINLLINTMLASTLAAGSISWLYYTDRLVEIGVGLLPAGGGCTNLWKKFIGTLPDPVPDADLGKFFIPAFMNIAMAKICMSAADARANGFLGPQDRIVFNRDYLIGEAKKEVLSMVDAGYTPPLKQPIPVMGEAGQGLIDAELFNMKSAGFVSEHDAYLASRVAYVLSGGEARSRGNVDEDVILALERQAFIDFVKQEKSVARIEHMLNTGKPLRN